MDSQLIWFSNGLWQIRSLIYQGRRWQVLISVCKENIKWLRKYLLPRLFPLRKRKKRSLNWSHLTRVTKFKRPRNIVKLLFQTMLRRSVYGTASWKWRRTLVLQQFMLTVEAWDKRLSSISLTSLLMNFSRKLKIYVQSKVKVPVIRSLRSYNQASEQMKQILPDIQSSLQSLREKSRMRQPYDLSSGSRSPFRTWKKRRQQEISQEAGQRHSQQKNEKM